MAEYQVTKHRTIKRSPSRITEQWVISAVNPKTGHLIACGSVTEVGGVYDVRTDAGAKCFRGTDSYDKRMAAVERWRAEQ